MPFESGTVVVCVQGNDSPSNHTHALPQNRHAIDFSSPTREVVDVVSAADGRVLFAYDGAPPDDFDAGAAYGNQVKIGHAWMNTQIQSVLQVDPQHPVALYLRADSVEIPLRHWDAADASLEAALRANSVPRRHQPWLPGRIYFALGVVAEAKGRVDEAHQMFERAIALAVTDSLMHEAKARIGAMAD